MSDPTIESAPNIIFQNYLRKIFISSLFLRKMNNIFNYLIFICLFTECIDLLMLKIIKDQESLFKFSASHLRELCGVVMALQ